MCTGRAQGFVGPVAKPKGIMAESESPHWETRRALIHEEEERGGGEGDRGPMRGRFSHGVIAGRRLNPALLE